MYKWKVLSWQLAVSLLCSSCASIKYMGNPDGSTSVSVNTLFADDVARDLHAKITKTGERSIDIGEISRNESTSLKYMSDILSKALEGAAKGAVEGAK